MKPAEHPEFFRFPAPEGRSRESTIVLRADGHFTHDGEAVAHPKLEQALHTWISRHPDDGRYILTNGYDWTYFTVEDAPYFVRHLLPSEASAPEPSADIPVTLVLTDGTEETLAPDDVTEGSDGALYTWVKRTAKGGPYEAKFTRHAQTSLARFLRPAESGTGDAAGPQVLLNHTRFLPKTRDSTTKK